MCCVVTSHGHVAAGFIHSPHSAYRASYSPIAIVQLDAEALQELVRQYKSIYAQHTGQEFPEDPDTALKMAILAVFR